MTKEDIKEFMPLMQAMLEGKTIQRHFDDRVSEWIDIEEIFVGLGASSYRIKPEPKYRPFRSMEECWQEMQKHQPFGWLKSKKNGRFLCIGEVSWKEGYGDVVITFYTSKPFSLYSNSAYREYTFPDGAPFGVIEE